MSKIDPRLNAYRRDLADARLAGKVEADRFVEAIRRRVTAFSAPLRREPRGDAALDSEVLCGEVFRVLEETGEGWSWGQLETDSYVGYVESEALGSEEPKPTHRATALRTFVYPGPDLKLPVRGAMSIGSRVALSGECETRGTVYAHLAGGEGAVIASHFAEFEDDFESDFVAVAERFAETPYLWGGRTSIGLDCSALVQLSLMACGHSAPRNSDMQERMLGQPLAGGIAGKLARGDLVFWPGHVAILLDGQNIVHASGYNMTVVREPLAEAIERIASKHDKPTSVRRIAF